MKQLTVNSGHYLDKRKNYVAHGKIRMEGKWLDRAGFVPGKKFKVELENGVITIKLITHENVE